MEMDTGGSRLILSIFYEKYPDINEYGDEKTDIRKTDTEKTSLGRVRV
ncbi:MAG: hypothetical protein ABEK59_02740 [Halobacteria archaeon]